MLFSSPEFIFLFLPFAVALHFALARVSVNAAVVGTTLSSQLGRVSEFLYYRF